MASPGYRRGGWELRYRDYGGRQRVERFPAPEDRRRPPEAALDRKAEVERELRRGSYVAREEREVTFGVYYERWLAARQISSPAPHHLAHTAAHRRVADVRRRPDLVRGAATARSRARR